MPILIPECDWGGRSASANDVFDIALNAGELKNVTINGSGGATTVLSRSEHAEFTISQRCGADECHAEW